MRNNCNLSHILLWLLLSVSVLPARPADVGRGIAVKTDLLYWLTATPNLSLEWPAAPRVSVSATFGYNAFNFFNRYDSEGQALNPKLHHWLLMPEGRYWMRAVSDGGYLGVHALGGQYNAGGVRFPRFLRHHRYEGWGLGAGISYGHRWHLSPSWAIEASAGASYLYLRYHKYECGSCGSLVASRHRHAVLPRAALSVVYTFPSNGGSSQISQIRPIRPISPADTILPSPIGQIGPIGPIPPTDSVPRKSQIQNSQFKIHRTSVRYSLDRHAIPDGADPADIVRLDSLLGTLADAGIISVTVTGHASPEHTEAYNLALSGRRARTLADHIARRLGMPPDSIAAIGAGEDWATLARLLAEASPPPPAALLSEPDPDRRDWLMRIRHPALRERLYPPLRRCDVTIVCRR